MKVYARYITFMASQASLDQVVDNALKPAKKGKMGSTKRREKMKEEGHNPHQFGILDLFGIHDLFDILSRSKYL